MLNKTAFWVEKCLKELIEAGHEDIFEIPPLGEAEAGGPLNWAQPG